ncbi:hypothetical protein TeGR_g186 [Tetraparma gracilis]|uniref:Uncharacterized protein n=1 Tax=Tetraparma gracilis TaxID=2962635 RepID=A0ABQ6N377_9STRA|nr:hypothetical protein TeGR_g186 [Tetraparma gracilis]
MSNPKDASLNPIASERNSIVTQRYDFTKPFTPSWWKSWFVRSNDDEERVENAINEEGVKQFSKKGGGTQEENDVNQNINFFSFGIINTQNTTKEWLDEEEKRTGVRPKRATTDDFGLHEEQ